MRYIPLMLLSMASRVATLCPKRLLRAKTGALRAAALHAATDDAAVIDDASSIYAIPERDVDEAAVRNWSKGTSRSTRRTLTKTDRKAHRGSIQTASEFARSRAAPLIIDAGCGTGRSALKLAERYPDTIPL